MRHRLLGGAFACLVVLSMLLTPALTFAAPNPTLEQKRAEHEKALADVKRVQDELAVKVNEYIKVTRDIEGTRVEISEATTQLAEIDVRLAGQEKALASRAVQLYRNERINIIEVLLDSRSIQDLYDRANYLYTVTSRDSRLLAEIRKTRAENAWLQESLLSRAQRLEGLQAAAEDQRKAIEAQLASQTAAAERLELDIAELMRAPKTFTGATVDNSQFQPDNVLSDANFRAADSMTVADIQAFLERQPGALDTYRTKDHYGVERSVAEIIAAAAVEHRISPKVILVTLQKEQSLLSDPTPSASQYSKAMGAGVPDGAKNAPGNMQGLGNQIWWGAFKLNSYEARFGWVAGKTMSIDGSTITPANAATFSQYTYTPHFKGVMSFWMLYWRYFGDPLAG